ncbi:MAG: MBL fold metallo-hydrolase, partial [Pyrinomonas methylaliphatogenes]|nr:MBL fold metallo-hydrolase [Pyrinomonas methylaliphatogenes]
MLKLSFWGAAGTVTGSKYLIETERARVLVDCGLFQGLKELRELNWTDPPFDPAALDACLITHAHIDHIGYLPRLVARGFSGPIYCTRATAELLRVSLLDAARLQEEEADYRNRHGLTSHTPALPLYTEEDARAVFDLLRAASNDGTPVEAARGIGASFRVAGHILGASHILVEAEGVNAPPLRVLFSGDLGRLDQPIIRPPAPPPACDYLLLESTYGDQLHDRTPPKDLLAAVINEAAESDAPLL